jgi:hypothetical protein
MTSKTLEVIKEQTAVATQYDNPWLEAADEAGSGFGKMLKFVKGEWLINEETVPEGTEYIVFIDEVARGYIKFEDKTVTDRKIVKVRDGKARHARNSATPIPLSGRWTRGPASLAIRGCCNGCCPWHR